jgi:myo-inositol 2-dehydrogenase / D-chiro-inositol 1-dehydrogenase
MVLLCGPPGFRPAQFEAAVAAGKHVFMEKPVATDSPGVRRVIAANELAKQKGLAVAVGHHLRHEVKHREAIARIHDGAIGDLQYVRAYFNSTGVWVRPRREGQTEMQYQVQNWYYFNWLSGDHIVEQHVHDLDVGNWMAQAVPVEAQGSGGRQVRIGPEYGEIFDHHTVEFTYANGRKMFSYCRHIPNCWNSFSQHAHGSQGSVHIEGHGHAEIRVVGQDPIRIDRGPAGHQLEHDHLFAALLAGEPYNEGDYGASSTMTAILGRMASYSGQVIRYDQALNSEIDLSPESLEWDAPTRVQPGPDGLYPCAMPGITKVGAVECVVPVERHPVRTGLQVLPTVGHLGLPQAETVDFAGVQVEIGVPIPELHEVSAIRTARRGHCKVRLQVHVHVFGDIAGQNQTGSANQKILVRPDRPIAHVMGRRRIVVLPNRLIEAELGVPAQ